MFDLHLFNLAVSSNDILGITEELDYLLSDYLESNINAAFYDFQDYFRTLDEGTQRAFINHSAFKEELTYFPKLTEV